MPSVSKLNNVKQVQDDLQRYFYTHFGAAQFNTYVLLSFYITKDDSTELMVILNLFQDLSAEKDKKRLVVRC